MTSASATTIRQSSIFVLDQDQALDFYVGTLGFEVHTDVDLGFMRWLTVCLPGQRDREVLLEVPGPPSMSPDTAAQVRDALTKGAAGGWLALVTDDARATAAELKAKGVDFTDEVSEKPYGVDFGIRDPFGNRIRIGSLAAPGESA
ncbi:VOC family protein [Nakamurella flava]|uniref:VOC family protein n=1 Tax=Nakamurella flava TaxID=2576308 RepID=A0A4V6CRS3_9ACTN|nr:VOC family protein [Nakamurella flava]TKV58685.1 VOC family protein [Nakamurella flava]